ncbi:MAG: hypothetical protein UHM08_08895 [Bacteroidales bacterium]|nr:hypothetical protein [Bacteroidales bacterium]
MTKNYLGYGYTNSRGVARLQYNPNDELLEKSGYENTNNYDTQVSASFSHQSKEYESNKKYYEKQTPSEEIIVFDDQSTDKRSMYITSPPNVVLEYVPNEYIQVPRDDIIDTYVNDPIYVEEGKKFKIEYELYSGSAVYMNMFTTTQWSATESEGIAIYFSGTAFDFSYCTKGENWHELVDGYLSSQIREKWVKYQYEIIGNYLTCDVSIGGDSIGLIQSSIPNFTKKSYFVGVTAYDNILRIRNFKISKMEE